MEQIKAPDGYENVDREKEPNNAKVGCDWLYRLPGEFQWSPTRNTGEPLRNMLSDVDYARPIRKRTLWVPASERQPPVGRYVPFRPSEKPGCGLYCRHHKSGGLDNEYLWLDLDAAEALEAERDRLAAENMRLRADCARISAEMGLPEGIAPATGEIARFIADCDSMRARIAELEAERDDWKRTAAYGDTPTARRLDEIASDVAEALGRIRGDGIKVNIVIKERNP